MVLTDAGSLGAFTPDIPDAPLPGLPDRALPRALAIDEKGQVPAHHTKPDGSPLYTNRLILESSPYLLQHAHNPVNWYAWGDEPFERARAEGKLVLLSVGYSTCHWCHVMERESFEDIQIAGYLNEHFISVKVDREERPDVDGVYMTAVQMLTGGGGWPMTVILTDDRVPVFGGTYFPPRDLLLGGRPGFLTLLRGMERLRVEEPERLRERAEELSQLIAKASDNGRPQDVPGPESVNRTVMTFARGFDETWGGFGQEPKFPRPSILELLLRFHRRTEDPESLKMVEVTLERMANGGIRDHVGGGFHRYSTDRRWLVPHFEKMLYDNAQLVVAYLEAYQATGRVELAEVARDTLRYIEREMTSVAGAFYSATDADSKNPAGHSDEGWYFTWTPDELEATLGEELAQVVTETYGVIPRGNFEGRNILHLPRSLDQTAQRLKLDRKTLDERLAEARTKLYDEREKRSPPFLDRKVLTSWNAMMISAFAKAALVFNERGYEATAVRAATFLIEKLGSEGDTLQRSYKDGTARYRGYLDDYAHFIAAALDLFETTQDRTWLEQAQRFQATLDRDFADEEGGYFFTGAKHEQLLARDKPDYDGAEPAGNSVALSNLLRFAELLQDKTYRARAEKGFGIFARLLEGHGEALPKMLTALDFYLDQPLQIIIVAAKGEEGTLMDVLRTCFLPNRVLVVVEEKDVAEVARVIPLVKNKKMIDGKPTAYVCRNETCELPTTDPEVFASQLKEVTEL